MVLLFLSGHGTQASLPAYRTNTSMSSRAQSKVLQRFRTGAVNTLIVTSVAEEGLDIPACNLVIVMDGFKLPASYVQSRGRARNMESEYVVMCERGNAGQLRMVANAKVAEMVTRDACRDLRLTEICYGDRKDVDDAFAENILGTADLDHPIAIKATGATLSVYSALDVLGRYCSALPHDMYTAAGKATFKEVPVEDGGMGFVFDLRLPIGSPLSMFYIRGVFGKCSWRVKILQLINNDLIIIQGRRLTKKLAMQSAAFKACRLLHERGALDDHLFSSTCSTSTTSAIALSHKQPRSKRAKLDAIAIYEDDALRDLDSTLAVDFYPHRIPRAFHRDEWVDVVGAETQLVTSREVLDWIDGKVARPPIPPVGTPVVLYVSYLTFDDTALELAGFDKETNDIRPAFALCTRRPLPTDLPAVQVFLGLDRIPSLVHVSHMEEIRLTQERWEIVRDFHMKLFANVMAMMSQPHDHSKADDGDDDTAGNGDTGMFCGVSI